MGRQRKGSWGCCGGGKTCAQLNGISTMVNTGYQRETEGWTLNFQPQHLAMLGYGGDSMGAQYLKCEWQPGSRSFKEGPYLDC